MVRICKAAVDDRLDRPARHPGSIAARLAIGLAISPSIFAGPGVAAEAPDLKPADMAKVAVIDERFQSYNIEMVEVTGGRFWKPYPPQAGATPSGVSPVPSERYAERPPIDLRNSSLRILASALAPAYLRVSGSWANATFFSDRKAASTKPPAGFDGVLSRDQWRGVVAFARAVDAPLVTSFAASPGTRDARGRWQPEQARHLLSLTRAIGGDIAAVEFINEPDLAQGLPAGYEPADYKRDFETFRAFMRATAPGVMILGPGTTGEGTVAANMIAVSAAGLDAISYHFYGAVSARCGGDQTPQDALSEQWLARTDQVLAFYHGLRDHLAPTRPIWLTETAQAACGGDVWSATFLDSFRYLDQLGRLAKAGVAVVMHNTLAASDYGLLDAHTFLPRPNYWAALLWRRLMGRTVLDADLPIQLGLHVYAHCMRDVAGGVSLLAINNDRGAPHQVRLAAASRRYTMETGEAGNLESGSVRLNGRTLALTSGDELPPLAGEPQVAGTISLGPTTNTFFAIPEAGNRWCQ